MKRNKHTSLERLWAGWRNSYVIEASSKKFSGASDKIFHQLAQSDHDDSETFIVYRGKTCFAILNIYPYTTGHMLILPYRIVKDLEDLEPAEFTEFFQTLGNAVTALKNAYNPDGINLGANLGRAAGAGIPDHLHFHCLPRFEGDTNFMASVANTKILPEALDETWRKIKDGWPTN